MGALDEWHLNLELENGVKSCCLELGFEQEPETIAIENAVRVLLQGLGEDVNREGIKKTPFRVAKALREGTIGYKQKVKDIVQSALFPEVGVDSGVGLAGGSGGLVIVRDLDHFSYCESCLLPFQVKCHIGYVPSGERVLGLSKFSRVASIFARRLQNPQRFADEICLALQNSVRPSGVAVVLECWHVNFPNLESTILHSNHQGFVNLVVSSGSGVFESETSEAWADFLSLLKLRGVKIDKNCKTNSARENWCPFLCSSNSKISSMLEPANPAMISAVSSILRALGEDPDRKELLGTPSRFVKWLMNFQNADLEMKLNGFADGKMDTKSNGEISHQKKKLRCEQNIPFWSMCEHHLLPFHGVVHIGYYFDDVMGHIGKSLLQSIAHFYGFKLQVQERLTRQIAETLSPLLGGDVIVVVEASHTCMISRGIEKFGSSTSTIAVLGRFSTDAEERAAFLDSVPKNL